MTMTYTTLANYGKALLDVIRGSEGLHAFPMDVRDGTITLGYGYTFIRKVSDTKWGIDKPVLIADLAKIGITLTDEDMRRLEAIRKSLSDGHNGTPAHTQLIADFTSRWCYAGLTPTDAQTLFDAEMTHQTKALRDKFIKSRPADGAAVFDGLAGTKELVAISSMFYNGPGLVRKELIDALANGNRAEAWYQIRYGWKDNNPTFNNGWAKRRYMESTVFGLNESTPSDPVAEAKDIYRMLQSHREEIFRKENLYGSQVGNANQDLRGALAVTGAGAVQSLTDSLNPACTTLLDSLSQSTDPSLKAAYDAWAANNRAGFVSTDLYFGSSFSGALDATLNESATGSNDVLIVDDTAPVRNWTLKGGKGDDLLIGGAGADNLYGGDGHDYLAGGGGDDKYYVKTGEQVLIEDKSGINTILLDDKALASFYRLAGGIYVSYDGSLTGELSNGEFIVYDNNGTRITLNQNFVEGDFGIRFVDAPTDPTNTIVGDYKWKQFGTDTNGNPIYHFDTLGNYITDPNQPGTVNDILHGSGGDDHITSGAGKDWVDGGAGNDLIEGGAGTDILQGGGGNDQLYGDAQLTTQQAIANGNTDVATGQKGDWLSGNAGDDTLVTGAGNDVLSGGAGNDLLIAGAGNDFILGDADYNAQSFDWTVTPQPGMYVFQPATGVTDPADSGNDVIYAGDGNDYVWAGGGNDTVYGEGGNDNLTGGTGNDFLSGGSGDDKLWGEGGDDTLFGGTGNDVLSGGTGANYLDGGDNNDILVTEGDNGTLLGGAGDDQLGANGGVNNNYLDGGAGNDTLVATGNNNYLDGGADNNTVQTVGNNNELFAGSGNDSVAAWGDGNYLDGGDGTNTVQAVGNNNELFGGSGRDYADGGAGNDLLIGGTGADILAGGNGDDRLYADTQMDAATAIAQGNANANINAQGDWLGGGAGSDTLVGSDANDALAGGGGSDLLIGGAGNDTYQFNLGDGPDTIYELNGADTIEFGAGITPDMLGFKLDVIPENGPVSTLYQFPNPNADLISYEDQRQALTITIGAGGDSLQIMSGKSAVEKYRFADGSEYTWQQLINRQGGINITDTNPDPYGTHTLDGLGMAATFNGGAGSDILYGGSRNDTYVFNLGDGADKIIDFGGTDEIAFGAGITAQDITWRWEQNNLGARFVVNVGTGGDSLVIVDGEKGAVENFRFADGSTLSYSQLIDLGVDLKGTAGDDLLMGGNDTMKPLNGASSAVLFWSEKLGAANDWMPLAA